MVKLIKKSILVGDTVSGLFFYYRGCGRRLVFCQRKPPEFIANGADIATGLFNSLMAFSYYPSEGV